MQNSRRVAYASRDITITQKSWVQIKEEIYAIVVGCERFHKFIAGKQIAVESDHKPLSRIFTRPINDIPVR